MTEQTINKVRQAILAMIEENRPFTERADMEPETFKADGVSRGLRMALKALGPKPEKEVILFGISEGERRNREHNGGHESNRHDYIYSNILAELRKEGYRIVHESETS